MMMLLTRSRNPFAGLCLLLLLVALTASSSVLGGSSDAVNGDGNYDILASVSGEEGDTDVQAVDILSDDGQDDDNDSSDAGDAEDSDRDGALATSSEMTSFAVLCWSRGKQYKTERFGSDPRRYKCGGRVYWYRGRHAYVHRCGKWYLSPRSNKYFSGGKWLIETVKPHPTNPTLERRACRWVSKPKTLAVRRMYRGKAGIWYRSRKSREYYTAGKWGNFEVRRSHPTDPRLVLAAGKWVKRTKPVPGESNWVKRCGAWWKSKPGAGSASYQYYYRGSWRELAGYRRHRNDPMYVFSKKCRFVRRSATKETILYRRYGSKVYKRGALPGGGFWFKRAGSLEYYKDGAWRLASRHLLDPRWMRDDRTGKWSPRPVASNPQIKRYVYDASKRTWYQDKTRQKYWVYGSWKIAPDSKASRAARAKAAAARRVVTHVVPLDLTAVVGKATNGQFARFLQWFTKKVVAKTRVYDPSRASRKELRRMDGYGPRRRAKNILNPEPGITSKRNLFNPEPPAGKKELELERLRKMTIAEHKDYGAPEPVWKDKGPSPDSKNAPVSDSLRNGNLAPWENRHPLAAVNPVAHPAAGYQLPE